MRHGKQHAEVAGVYEIDDIAQVGPMVDLEEVTLLASSLTTTYGSRSRPYRFPPLLTEKYPGRRGQVSSHDAVVFVDRDTFAL